MSYLFKEVFLSQEYFFEAENPHPAIIDCGANLGMSILYFKFLYPDCSIVAFEPNPHAFALLERNVLQNNLKDVELNNVGLSNVEGSIAFFLGENKGGLSSSMIQERGGKNVINIQTAKLSKFIQNKTFDLIKIDVEGAEAKVIEDLVSENKIGNSKRYIVEYHHRINKKKASFAAFIKPSRTSGLSITYERTTYS